MPRLVTSSLLVVLCACLSTSAAPDASVADAGADAPVELDAGRRVRDAGPADAGFTQASPETWCHSQALASCWRAERCLSISAPQLAQCLARTMAGCDQDALTRAVNEGRLRFSEANALSCLNDYDHGRCSDEPSSCAGVWRGLVQDGGCILPSECDPSSGFCYSYDNQCPHRCHPWTPTGAPCDGFTTQCDPSRDTCYASDGGPALCQRAKALGEGCVEYDECTAGLYCLSGTCVLRQADGGQPCGVKNGFPFCPPDFFCRQATVPDGMEPPPGVCERLSGVGGACVGGGSCLPSLRCSTVVTTGVCQARVSLGQRCVSYDDCEEDLFCSGSSGVCEHLPEDGGDCSSRGSYFRCGPAAYCKFNGADDERCLLKQALGGPCGYDGECLSNECAQGLLPDGGFGGRCIESCAHRADGGF